MSGGSGGSVLWACLSSWFLLVTVTSNPPFVIGDIPNKLVSGVYVEDLPVPIFYDTFIPIILEYVLPHWNRSDVTFNNWYNCTTETTPYRYTCPSVFHMNRAILNLHIDFLALQPVTDAYPHTEYYDRLLSHSDFCDVIQRHFSSIYVQNDELDAYIRALEKCNTNWEDNDIGLVFIERSLGDYNFSIRYPFTKMESNFYNVFYRVINAATVSSNTSLDLVASATLSNARATIQGMLLSVYYAEKYRWYHAIQDCNAQLIPHSLISSQRFEEKLDEMSKHGRFMFNYEFSVPMNLMSKYYNLPIADCTYTNDSYVVRIQIPVKSIGRPELSQRAYRLVTLKPVPFMYRTRVCNVVVDSEQKYAVDVLNSVTYRTNCKSNELCFNPTTFAYRFIDFCATALINENFKEVIAYCPFECRKLGRMSDERHGGVLRVGTDKFIVTGPGVTGMINCQFEGESSPPSSASATHESSQAPTEPKLDQSQFEIENDGAVEVTLPCHCTMTVFSKRFYPSNTRHTCGTETKITYLTPWHLINEKKESKSGDICPDEDLLNFYIGKGHHFNSSRGNRHRPSTGSDPVEPSSQLPIWILFSLISIILFLIQCYILYILRRPTSGGYNHHQLLFKARDPEPQIGLLETAHEIM